MHWIFWWYDTTKICWARFSISISSRNLKITVSLIVNLEKEIYRYQQSRWLFICCWIHYWVNQQSKTNAFTWLVYVTEIDLYNVFRKWLPCPRCNSARNAPCFGISSWTDAPRCWGRFSKMIIWPKVDKKFLKTFWSNLWISTGRISKMVSDLNTSYWRPISGLIKANCMITTLLCIIFH